MPKISDNADGTQTWSINSAELNGVRNLLGERIPGLKKAVEIADGPGVKVTLRFLKNAIS